MPGTESNPISPVRSERILVLGGTGHYGRHIVGALLRLGADVRVLTRNEERARQLLGQDIDVVEGDLRSRDDRARALAGSSRIVISVAALDRRLIRHRMQIERDAVLSLLEEAQREMPVRIVYISGYEMREEFARRLGLLEFARPQLDVEKALSSSSLRWTVLGCAPSMDIFFAMMHRNVLNVPGGGPPALPVVSALDVGQIAAQAALRDDLTERRFRVTGPEAMSFPEAARRIGRVWGRPIRYRRIPLMPLRIAAGLSRPVTPYLAFIMMAVRLLNNFPQDLTALVPEDHSKLRATFDYEPKTLEQEASRRAAAITPVSR